MQNSRTGTDRPSSLLSIPHAQAWTPCSIQRIPAYSNVFPAIQEGRPTYSSLFQGIPAYSSLFPDKKIS